MSGGEVEFLRLTGQPRAKRGSDEIAFLPDKRFHLLTYLAYNSGWVGRERAAFLFWPDADTEASRRNLRGLLQRLRTLPFEPGIEANKHQLRWQVPTDVKAFNEAIERGDADRAIELYEGPLLEGMEADDAGEFGEWLEIAREELRSRWRALALSRLAATQTGAERGAETLVRRLLDEDPLDEEALRTFLTTMGRLGHPLAARGLYREFSARLERELGLEPTSETVAAFEALRGLEASVVDSALTQAETQLVMRSSAPLPDSEPIRRPLAVPDDGVEVGTSARRFANLPRLSTRFVGREVELGEIAERLLDAECRMLSIVGQGGVGKTRLALAAAHQLALDEKSGFDDGILFVPLDITRNAAEVVPVLADALGIRPVPGEDLTLRVLAALRDARALLVLDNFEHVLDAAEVVPRLLATSEGLKVLVTTRERLGLEAEWTYPVEGLDCPAPTEPLSRLDAYGAVRLLVDRAQRVRPGFELTEDDLPSLNKLWEITEGLPLAIELTAAWLRAVPLRTLVEDLADNLDMLTTATRDSITRHGSIRGIFEQSWSNLTEPERQALSRLSVFSAPVSPAAASFVTGAARATMAALIDKSLLRLDRTGRYDRHPLLYAFSRAKLEESEVDLKESEQRHSSYYLRFLRERTDRARGLEPVPVMREIAAEMREILAVTRRARDAGSSEELINLMHVLEMQIGYFQAHGHTGETLELLETAAEAAVKAGRLDIAHDLKGRVGDAHGIHRGDALRALKEYRAAAEMANSTGNLGREAVFISLCSLMQHALGEDVAWDELDRALSLAQIADDGPTLALVLEHRGYVLVQTERHDEALECYRASLRTIEASASDSPVDSYDVARLRFFATLNIGGLEHLLGRFEDSLNSRREALRVAEQRGNSIWKAHVHLEMGEVYGDMGRHDEAKAHIEIAAAIYEESHVTANLDRVNSLLARVGSEVSATEG